MKRNIVRKNAGSVITGKNSRKRKLITKVEKEQPNTIQLTYHFSGEYKVKENDLLPWLDKRNYYRDCFDGRIIS
jgi:hypothetical protein